jgi:hypothetical protein
MPWVFEQGIVLSVVDDYLSDPARAAKTLTALRPVPFGLGQPVARTGGLASQNLQQLHVHGKTISATEHLEQHWYGRDPQGNEVPTWWRGWTGDAEEIMRWTLITAIEISLGVEHIPPLSKRATIPTITPTRGWPIHIYWSCGAPFFQGWVSWHRHGPGNREGVVNVALCTPGTGEQLNATPHDRNPITSTMPGAEDPATTVGDHGLWVIGQESTEQVIGSDPPVLIGRAKGQGLLPLDYGGLALHTFGKIVIASPAEATGGVLP